MNTVHILVKNTITIENGEIITIKEIMPQYGFYYGDYGLTHCVLKHNSLNKSWGLDKETGYNITGQQHEEEFYSRFGCEPYEYVTLTQRTR